MSNTGVCPVCNGTGKMPCPDEATRGYGLKNGWYGYDKDTDTITCTNCGGQYMYSKPTGIVKLNKDGVPCKHEYTYAKGRWNCTHDYTCIHCGDHYMIDSGD